MISETLPHLERRSTIALGDCLESEVTAHEGLLPAASSTAIGRVAQEKDLAALGLSQLALALRHYFNLMPVHQDES